MNLFVEYYINFGQNKTLKQLKAKIVELPEDIQVFLMSDVRMKKVTDFIRNFKKSLLVDNTNQNLNKREMKSTSKDVNKQVEAGVKYESDDIAKQA